MPAHRGVNILLLVVDSLRASSLRDGRGERPRTPFLDQLDRATLQFQHAYATECWTLPSHCSMFTGLLPSEHGAHFHTMAYTKPTPTVAELLSEAGLHTELVTRNFMFDGTIPGITRGFQKNTQILSEVGHPTLYALYLAAAKPRFRRHIKTTGFFHPLQQESRRFLTTFARAMLPADRRALDYILEQMAHHRRRGKRYFVFCNLYDVHAPYPPSERSILRPLSSWRGLMESLTMHLPLAKIGAHSYLRPRFRISEYGRRLLLCRYHTAIELMDRKLQDFWSAARGAGFLDDTLLIITSDHGEAFGEHRLYLHDASVYNTHLHVPLWVYHPECAQGIVDDVVSTRDLFGLMRTAGLGEGIRQTILDSDYRDAHPVALAEHFYYPHLPDILPQYKQNIAAAIAGPRKVIQRRSGVEHYDLNRDPDELLPAEGTLEDLAAACRSDGLPNAAIDAAVQHLRRRHNGSEAAAA